MLTSPLLGFRLPGHEEVDMLSTHLICQSWNTGVSWEEVERCESALLLFSATTDSFKTASQQSLVLDTGCGVLPARKQIQNVSLKIIWQHSFSAWILWFCYVIYTKQLVVEFIWLNASSYTCRSHQKTVVSIGIHHELTGVELSSETWPSCCIYLGGGDLNGVECVRSTSAPYSFISSEKGSVGDVKRVPMIWTKMR